MRKREIGRFTIPTRVYLDEEQRAKLERLIREEDCDLSELLSELLADYLADKRLPAPEPRASALETLRQRRDEATRLAARSQGGQQLPGWFESYVSQLDQEIKQLERERNAD
jgi:hypothetical protein